jgi:hypothetical protein
LYRHSGLFLLQPADIRARMREQNESAPKQGKIAATSLQVHAKQSSSATRLPQQGLDCFAVNHSHHRKRDQYS